MKRSQTDAQMTQNRPSKRRKAAEASAAKVKQIAEAEEDIEVEELLDEGNEQVFGEEEIEASAPAPANATTVVAPGFRLWQGGELAGMSKHDKSKEEYSHALKVVQKEAFTLIPLVVTQGPYKGRRVIMLEPTSDFRFNDLPAEIRGIIFSHLLEEDEPIKMSSTKGTHEAKRPVRDSHKTGYQGHKGFTYDRTTAKWKGQPPSALAILQVSKQMLHETAPVVYGNNRFSFKDLTELKLFLDRIGDMRHYIRHIHIGKYGYQSTKAQSAFHAMKGLTDLRTISFSHDNVCLERAIRYSRSTSPGDLSYDVAPMLRALRKAHFKSGSGVNVLDLIKVEWERCSTCSACAPDFPPKDEDCKSTGKAAYPYMFWGSTHHCKVTCKDAAAHCKEVEAKIRKHIAERLRIKE